MALAMVLEYPMDISVWHAEVQELYHAPPVQAIEWGSKWQNNKSDKDGIMQTLAFKMVLKSLELNLIAKLKDISNVQPNSDVREHICILEKCMNWEWA